ncbi:Protein root UVB sensitive 3 [Hibiscus syriacus]|uniref:Protein root UVB sensitive 3 n=1 Tax=Hibiscus syriacus TaxID=106335 RepID=A0A6A3C9U7_HIBSY|nr:Protein root UVB sensitive 3 [Hibiscus syriacus]
MERIFLYQAFQNRHHHFLLQSKGFPDSVTPDMFSSMGLVAGTSECYWSCGEKSATIIGATFQALLSAIGVGEKSATYRCNFSVVLERSDGNAWRHIIHTLPDLMNDLGMLMDLLPLFPSAFIFIVCLGSLSRSFTGVPVEQPELLLHSILPSKKCSRYPLRYLERRKPRDLATMIGMALGMLLAQITTENPLAIWFSFLSLTMFHMYANYKAVRCLALDSLNFERSSILLQNFIESGQVLSPKQVSTMEHVLPLWTTLKSSKTAKPLHPNVKLGLRVSTLDHLEMANLNSAGSFYNKAKYILVERKGIVSVVVHKDSTGADTLRSYIHALVMVNLMAENKSLHLESQSWMDKHYESFVQKLKLAGWKTERLLSHSIIWKARWSLDEKTD